MATIYRGKIIIVIQTIESYTEQENRQILSSKLLEIEICLPPATHHKKFWITIQYPDNNMKRLGKLRFLIVKKNLRGHIQRHIGKSPYDGVAYQMKDLDEYPL